MAAHQHRIEVVRGSLDAERIAQVKRFWAERIGLEDAMAEARLAQVVCVLRDPDGRMVGINSAFASKVPMLAGRLLWVYRMLIDDDWQREASASMVAAAFAELERSFAGGAEPIGLCLQLESTSDFPNDRAAYWPDLGMVYAGYLDDGRQLRVRYFEGARI